MASSFTFDDDNFEFSDEHFVADDDFFNRPIDAGLEIDNEGQVEQQFEATFEQELQQKIDIGELDPRNARDKPLIQIGQEMELIGLSRDYIQTFLLELRAKQDDTLLALPFLNARYVANAKVYLDEVDGKVTPKSIEDYIKRRNREIEDLNLDKNDFYRYVKIDQKIL